MKIERIADIRGTSFRSLEKPFRVVSLVPSWTETLFYLGLGEKEIVGRTDYCIHPKPRVDGIESVGGPKDPDLGRVFELSPDLILTDREENRREDVERIDDHWIKSRVFVTGPTTVDHALDDVERFGLLFNTQGQARELIENVKLYQGQIVKKYRGTVAYLTWQDPFIVASRETYVGDVLEFLGYRNVFDHSILEGLNVEGSLNYPMVTLELLVHLKPDFIFLSTEPFPFRRKDVDSLRLHLCQFDPGYAKRVTIRIVNGEYYSWYGSRMIPAFRYFVRHQDRH